ncbi:DUF4352 domain-containing protein [Paractinoplanes rhizophilus]|uniref:DUF4352 domain-containing protein n=1 Tax=Paractinoplanes rhizophilus TaxID=1416877 RepID=A0ABW2HV96_9ACTN
MSYPQQPQPVAQPQPTKHHRWHWIAGGVALVVALGCGAASGGKDAADTEAAQAATTAPTKEATGKPKTKQDKTPGLNQPARDGKFEFTVTRVKCGATKVGSSLLGEKAQGQYCLITLRVKNIGKEAQAFADSAQKAYDAKKVEYSADSGAGIYVNEDNQVLFQDINPGNAVTGTLVFDVPKGTKLTSLELHDSVFSGGVAVKLQ